MRIGYYGIRFKINAGLLLTIAVLSTLLTYQARVYFRDAMSQQLEITGVALARSIALHSTDLIISGNTYALHDLLMSHIQPGTQVRYAFILDSEGMILASTFGQSLPPGLKEANAPSSEGKGYNVRIIQTEEGQIHDIALPILGGQAGVVRIGLSEATVVESLNYLTDRFLFLTALTFLAATLFAYGLVRTIIGPLEDLVHASRSLIKGNLSARVRIRSRDEIGVLAEIFNQMAASLQKTIDEIHYKEHVRRLLLQKIIKAQEEERKRVARELHDETGQCLTSLLVGLKGLETMDSVAAIREHIASLRELANSTLQGVQYLSRLLRPSALDDLGLVPALEKYAHDFCDRFGIAVDFHAHGMDWCRLPHEVEITLYRIVQEALTNVAKHSGATSVSVILKYDSNLKEVSVIIEDDGHGFDACRVITEASSLGLAGMRERAELIGGKMSIESSPERGTAVYVRVPIAQGGETFAKSG